MSVPYQIRDWLQTAFIEQVDSLNETYFFDRRVNEFYSVFITDYFLTDPQSTDTYSNSPYSADELATLSERIDRQERNDPSILLVPRLTVEERREMMQRFLDEVNLRHDTTLQGIAETENGRTRLDFNNKLTTDLNDKWQQFKREFVQSKIDTFCNLHRIDLETATLWTDKKMTTVSLDLNDTPRNAVVSTKPWWKFW